MDFQIITDSSSDLSADYFTDDKIGFDIVPLTINVGENEYVDNDSIDKNIMLSDLATTKGKASSSCPSPQAWADVFKRAQNTFAVCISSKLSGTYNSALQARDLVLSEFPDKKIYVVDTLAAAGTMILAAERLMQSLKQGLSFEETQRNIDEFIRQRTLIFSLENFNMLIKTGRMNKLVGLTATALGIRAIARAENGSIKVVDKARGTQKALEKIVDLMEILKPGFKFLDAPQIIINHCNNSESAEMLRKLIMERYERVTDVRLFETKGLCSFYASNGGLILSY